MLTRIKPVITMVSSIMTMIMVTMVLAALVTPNISQSAALTDPEENRQIDCFRGQTCTFPSTIYVALFTTCPTDSTAGVEVSGGGYARPSLAANLTNWAGTQGAGTTTASTGTSGVTSNNVAITFAVATADWGTVTCLGFMTASSGGTVYLYTSLTTSRSIPNGSTAVFPAGSITYTIN